MSNKETYLEVAEGIANNIEQRHWFLCNFLPYGDARDKFQDLFDPEWDAEEAFCIAWFSYEVKKKRGQSRDLIPVREANEDRMTALLLLACMEE